MLDLFNDRAYRKLKNDPTSKTERRINEYLKRLEKNGFIMEKEYKALSSQYATPPYIYGLPKIHKDGTSLRPIVSSLDHHPLNWLRTCKDTITTHWQNRNICEELNGVCGMYERTSQKRTAW